MSEVSQVSAPRPKFSKEIAALAAATIVSRLIEDGHLEEDDRADSVASLAKHGRQHADGYQIARDLERYDYWDCDFEICEILNGFCSEVYHQINKAEKEWAAATSPLPPLPLGTRIRVSEKETGEITGIYEYGAAKYLVKIDGDLRAAGPEGSRRIINFENAHALEAA